ncbi:F0F1 ATP synthase subunit A [Candidatus Babeliales bacterium]|nr:F0F1 ATP synthase subunit A [Candidatus Babeliales bacterium]
MKIAVFEEKLIKPFEVFGLTGDFWGVHIDTLKDTWIAMVIMFALILIGRFFLRKGLNPVALIFEKAVSFFDNLCKESFGGKFKYKYFCFVSTIFFFTLFCCLVGLLPYVDETTKDLNTAFALGSLSFFYVQVQKIKLHGIIAYLKEFTHPFFILLPLNIIGEIAKIASMSFRLFGNILGGSIIFLIAINALSIYRTYFIIFSLGFLIIYWLIRKLITLEEHKILDWTLKAFLVAVFFIAGTQMFFGIFEGFVQSFVLTMLTITYLSVALQNEGETVEE